MNATQQPFSKINFWLIGGCCFLIIIGFLLMVGGGSSVEEGFNPDIFSARRIIVGPLLAFIGFLLLAFAILVEPKELYRKIKNYRNSKTSNPSKKEEIKQEDTELL